MMRPRGLSPFLALLLAGCAVDEPREPTSGSFAWITYENEAAGFTMEVPDVYHAEEEDGGRAVLFRSADGVPVKVYWTTEAEASGRGLWYGETPAARTRLGGIDGDLFQYRHCDGPLCSRMVSHVIRHRGRDLALEFRSDGPLNRTNAHILDSFGTTDRTARPDPARPDDGSRD